MPLTPEEFVEVVHLICPHCRRGIPLSRRPDTGEWYHEHEGKAVFSHALCWANGLRNSRFAREAA
jgi:hypothetical protein